MDGILELPAPIAGARPMKASASDTHAFVEAT
jgi:hypothetical protein